MKTFDEGWLNCFDSFVRVMYDCACKYNSDSYNDMSVLDDVMCGAGISTDDIKEFLKVENLSYVTYDYFQRYLELQNDDR